jgi:hypothetical protein
MASKRFRDAVGIDPDRIVSAAIDAALGEAQPRKKKHHPGRVLAAGAAVAAAAAVGQRRLPRLAKVPLRMGLHKLGDMAHVDDIADAVRDRADAVRDRLTGDGREPEDEYYDDEEFDDEEFDDEPRDEADEPPDDEDFDDEDDEGFDDEPPEDDDDPPEDDDGPRGEGDEVDEEDLDDDDLEGEPEDAVEDEPEDVEDDEPEEDVEDDEPPEDDDVDPEEDDEQIAARSLDLGVERGDNGTRDRDRVPDLFEALRTPHRRAPVMRRRSHRVDPATRPPEPDKKRPGNERRDRRPKQSKSKAARA